jgi:hypothetical protein
MKKNIIKLIPKTTESQFNDIIKKLKINLVTLTMKQKEDIKPDEIKIKKETLNPNERCD